MLPVFQQAALHFILNDSSIFVGRNTYLDRAVKLIGPEK